MTKKTFDAELVARAQQILSRRSALELIAKLPSAKSASRPDDNWFRIVNAKEDEAEIFIYDEIGFWGTNAQGFLDELREVTAKVINIRINSPGGSVFDGIAIYNALAQHSSKIIVHIDALAASIASVIAMAGDEIRISEVAQVMIHKPWSFVMGTDDDMLKEAEILGSLEEAIIDIYVARTGGDRDAIKKWVKSETWFKGQAAVDAGFADKTEKLVKPVKATARLGGDFFAEIFPNMPDEVRAALTPKAETPKPVDEMTPREFEAFLKSHGASNKRAKDILMQGFKALPQEEEVKPSDPPDRERTEQKSQEETARAAELAELVGTITRAAQSMQVVAAIHAAARSLRT